MKPLYYDIEPLGDLLDYICKDGSANVIRRIVKRLRTDNQSNIISALSRYEDFFSQFASYIRQHGKLIDEDYEKLHQLFNKIQKQLTSASQVELGKIDDHGKNTLKALHLLGGLEVDFANKNVSLFISPRMLTRAFSVASLLDDSSRTKHIHAIASIRKDPDKDFCSELEERYVGLFVSELREKLREMAMDIIHPSMRASGLELLSIEYLPTATDFYEAGIDYYSSSAGEKREHYIFATTSGILLPEEYFGSPFYEKVLPIPKLAKESDKNPKREEYFEALANVRGRPRWYFFEISRAGDSFKKTIKKLESYGGEKLCEQYREQSKKTIARFLQLPHFGLLGVNKFPDQFDHLTLGNGRNLILSGRDRPEREHKIGHGLWLRPSSSELKQIWKEIKMFEAKDWIKTFAGAVGMSMLREDPRLKILEALFTGFAIPFFMGLWRYGHKSNALDTILNIGEHVTKTLGNVSLPFTFPPDSKPLKNKEATKEAEKILLMLES